MTKEQHAPASAALVRRVIKARAAYSAAAGPDFLSTSRELDHAVEAFTSYSCKKNQDNCVDWAVHATLLHHYIALEKADADAFGEDHVGPLWEFWPIAAAVEREFKRLMCLKGAYLNYHISP
jgi:hypothetical protein